MSFTSVAAKNLVRRLVAVMTIAAAAVIIVTLPEEFSVRAQSRQHDESTGIDGIAQTLVSAFDQADILALGEAHGRKLDSDLRIAVVRHPDFAKKVRTIVVEFGSTSEQATLDRYIRGETISAAQLAQVWKTAGQAANGDASIYTAFFTAV